MDSEELQCPKCGSPVEFEPTGGLWNVCRCHNCGWHGRRESCAVAVIDHRQEIRDEENQAWRIEQIMDEMEQERNPERDKNDF